MLGHAQFWEPEMMLPMLHRQMLRSQLARKENNHPHISTSTAKLCPAMAYDRGRAARAQIERAAHALRSDEPILVYKNRNSSHSRNIVVILK